MLTIAWDPADYRDPWLLHLETLIWLCHQMLDACGANFFQQLYCGYSVGSDELVVHAY
jgi:hypothetical protein